MASLSELYQRYGKPVVAGLDKFNQVVNPAYNLYRNVQPVHTAVNIAVRSGVNAVFRPSVASDRPLTGTQQDQVVQNFNTQGNHSIPAQVGNFVGSLAAMNPEAAAVRLGSNLGNIGTPKQLVQNPGRTAGAFLDYGVNRFAGKPEVGAVEKIATTPFRRFAGYGTLRGGEAVLSNQAQSLQDTGQLDLNPANNRNAFATGFAVNSILSPKVTAKAAARIGTAAGDAVNVGNIRNAARTFEANPMRSALPEGVNVSQYGEPYTPKEPVPLRDVPVDEKTAKNILTYGKKVDKPIIYQYGSNPSSQPVTLKVDEAGNVRSWTTSNPEFAKRYTDSPALPQPGFLDVSLSKPSSSNEYLNYLSEQQKLAKSTEKGTVGQKVNSTIADIKRKLVDSAAPIEDTLFKAQKEGKYVVRPGSNITNNIDRVYRSKQLAGQFALDNGLVEAIKKAPDVNALDQYLIAKHVPDVATTTGRDAAKDAQLVRELGPTYEPVAQKVVQYSKNLKKYMVDSGLISPELSAKLDEQYPNYVPINRIFSELEEKGAIQGSGKGIASLSKQTVVQKLQGSERAIASPTESLLTKTLDAFSQGERNKAAQTLASYKDLPGNPFEITPLRTAENVKERISLFSQAKDLKPVQNLYERMVSTRTGWQKSLESEINKLNQQGLYQSLKEKFPENTTIQSSIDQVSKDKKTLVNLGTDKFYAPEGNPTITLKQKYAIPSKSDFKTIISNLINLPSSEVEKIKSKIATRENKLAPILDQIANMSDLVDNIKQQRGSLIDEARLLKDAESKGLATFSALKGGIKEIYQTTPEIAAAAKLLDKQQLGFIGKLFSLPVRIARIGITGINVPFTAANVAKDQVSAFINSDKALQTSIANPKVFAQSLWEAIGHGKQYEEWIRNAGGGTSFDISRSAPEVNIAKIRSGKNIASKAAYTVTHPGELMRAAEDVIGRSEEITRLQQFIGTRDALIKQGRTMEDANILASKASRENTVNFARSGDWGKALNSVFLYMNAGIQGSRTLVRNLAQNPVGTSSKIALTVFAPVAAVTAWNLGSPERKAAYDDIADYEKENNLVIVPPNPTKDPKTGKWNVIKVPFSQEIANLTDPVRKSVEAMSGYDAPGFTEVAAGLLGTATSLNTQSKGSLIGQFIPQAVKPPLEGFLNKNLYSGQDIVPQYLNGQQSKNLPPDQQVKLNTSGTARIIGKVTNTSPLKVQQFVKSTFGGVGDQVINASDTALNKAGVIPEEQIGGQSIPAGLTSRFTQATGGQLLTNQYNGVKSPPGYVVSPDAPKNALQTVQLYADALIHDPKNAIEGIFTAERLRKMNGDIAVFERKNGLGNQDNGDPTTQIDHKIALTLGGSNNQDNLQVLPANENAAKGMIEVYLTNLVKSGKISESEAQQRDLNWKNELSNVPAATKKLSELPSITSSSVKRDTSTVASTIPDYSKDITENKDSYYATISGSVKKFSSKEDANLALAKENIKKGNLGTVSDGSKIYYKTPSGSVVNKDIATLQSQAADQQLTNKIDSAKRTDDYSTWFSLQKQKYTALQQKIDNADPVLDQANVLKWQNQQQDLISSVQKTKVYGNSFKKPKAPKKGRKVSIKSPNFKLSTSSTKLTISKPKVVAPKAKKFTVKAPRATVKQPKR